MHALAAPDREIQVLKGATTDKAFYNGLQVCAMPWTCPVCATKISERRRNEVAKAIKQAEVLGLQVFLLTLTVPHGLGDDVNEILDKMMSAWKRLWQGRQGMELRNALGLFGHIRALEVTHGENGFHPHFHALLFFHPQQTTPAGWECFFPDGKPQRYGLASLVLLTHMAVALMAVARRQATSRRASGD